MQPLPLSFSDFCHEMKILREWHRSAKDGPSSIDCTRMVLWGKENCFVCWTKERQEFYGSIFFGNFLLRVNQAEKLFLSWARQTKHSTFFLTIGPQWTQRRECLSSRKIPMLISSTKAPEIMNNIDECPKKCDVLQGHRGKLCLAFLWSSSLLLLWISSSPLLFSGSFLSSSSPSSPPFPLLLPFPPFSSLLSLLLCVSVVCCVVCLYLFVYMCALYFQKRCFCKIWVTRQKCIHQRRRESFCRQPITGDSMFWDQDGLSFSFFGVKNFLWNEIQWNHTCTLARFSYVDPNNTAHNIYHNRGRLMLLCIGPKKKERDRHFLLRPFTGWHARSFCLL